MTIKGEISALRDEMNAALAVAVLTATKEIAAIRADGQKQLDELRRRIDALEHRLLMVAGAGNAMPPPPLPHSQG
jgi:ElaB/YqjD/DUF883 family membrane-anchored ribosome-binding protein